MARRTKSGIQFFADFTGVEKSLGAAWGALDALENKNYQNEIVRAAWAEANDAFNLEAAAFAAAGGNIKHMYEWGTVGINRGRTNLRPNPMSDRARLWTPFLEGEGLNLQFDYSFKPSIAFVPKPTVGDTGMSPDVISQLRDHVFWNKAMVMELGHTVTIARKDAQFLLFPMYKGNIPPGARANDIARGYTLHPGPVTLRPGARTVGQFNAYWVQFWEGRGNEMLNASIEKQINMDLESEIARPRRANGTFRPVVPGSIRKAIETQRKRVERNAVRRAAARRRRKENG